MGLFFFFFAIEPVLSNPVSPAPEAMVGAPSRAIVSRVLISGALKRLTLRGSVTDGWNGVVVGDDCACAEATCAKANAGTASAKARR